MGRCERRHPLSFVVHVPSVSFRTFNTPLAIAFLSYAVKFQKLFLLNTTSYEVFRVR